jgi:hypothetical protein
VKRRLLITLSITGACAAGVVCGELLFRLPAFRSATGILFKRGHLLALAQGHGIYEADLRRLSPNGDAQRASMRTTDRKKMRGA